MDYSNYEERSRSAREWLRSRGFESPYAYPESAGAQEAVEEEKKSPSRIGNKNINDYKPRGFKAYPETDEDEEEEDSEDEV